MDARLSDKGAELLALTPYILHEDPQIAGTFAAMGHESERLEEARLAMIAGAFPIEAEDPYLALWERTLELPVEPEGRTLEQRRLSVLTFLRRLANSQQALVWRERLEELLTTFKYSVHHDDELKALYRDRFDGDTLAAVWNYLVGTADNVLLADGDLTFVDDKEFLVYLTQPMVDQFGILHLTRGSASACETGVILKWADKDNYLLAHLTSGKIKIVKKDGGVFTTLKEETYAHAEGKDYWLKATVRGNKIRAELTDLDPARAPTPLKAFEYTLAGGDATQFGSGVEGKAGLRKTGAATGWVWKDFLMGEADNDVAEYTVRIILHGAEGGVTAGQAERLARDITPAKLDIEVLYDTGFILGDEIFGVLGEASL